MVTSQPGTVDLTVTYFSSHRRLELKSDPRENNAHPCAQRTLHPFCVVSHSCTFGVESLFCTLQSGLMTRSFVPTNLIPMVGSSQKSRNCVRTTMKDEQQITCQSSHTCTRDPDAWTTIHQQETMTQHPHAVADHGRKQHRTATNLPDLIRPILPRPHFGSGVVNKCTVLLKTMSGMCGRALDCDHPPTAIQKGDKNVVCYERCEMCGNRWWRIPRTMVERNPEMKLNNRTVLASTGKRPVEIERPFCPHGHGSDEIPCS